MIRFLKAKLRVMQEEMDRMNAEAKEKVCVIVCECVYVCGVYWC